MTPDGKELAGTVLSQKEIEALETAEYVFGAAAKLAAGEFVADLGVETTSAEQFMGRVSIGLERMDFEQKQSVRDNFQQLNDLFGQVAVKQEARVVPLAAASTEEPAAIKPHESLDVKENEEPKFLKHYQQNFLKKIFGEGNIAVIEDLTPEQAETLVLQVADVYKALKIARLNPTAKRVRAEQMIAYIQGESRADIAKRYGTTENALTVGLDNMTKSITKRVNPGELSTILGEVIKV
jgi:hypothetical protein